MAERVVTPTGQRHFIEPFDQRVFQFDTDKSDVFLSRVANSVYQVLGNDIVMYGLDVENIAHTTDSVVASVTGGAAIQDQTLIYTPDPVDLEMNGVSGMDEAGKIVILLNYNYLETFEQNRHSILMNFIDPAGNPLHPFLPQRDRIVLEILEFTKDSSDNITGVTRSPDRTILIDGTLYFVKGFTDQNKRLTSYLVHQLFTGANSSIELHPDMGMRLLGDVLQPGNFKFYGTNQIGAKGWYDLSTLSVDNASDLLEFQKQYNMVFYNGNLFFVETGHSINYELYPFWQTFTNDLSWTGEIDIVYSPTGNTWDISGPNPQMKVKDGTTWANGYRPIKFKIEDVLVPDDGSVEISLIDRNGNVIAHSDSYRLNDELLIDWSNGENLYRIILPGASQIRGLKFFGGTPGNVNL